MFLKMVIPVGHGWSKSKVKLKNFFQKLYMFPSIQTTRNPKKVLSEFLEKASGRFGAKLVPRSLKSPEKRFFVKFVFVNIFKKIHRV
jgi:hypothetical protein